MKRLDVLLMERTGCSRGYAQEIIKAGLTTLNGKTVTKPGVMADEGAAVETTAPPMRYAGRGGYKLEGALKSFGLSVEGFACLDAGASTGGFTDCLLQNGASSVFAVDVGSGQLAERLRLDTRVTVRENTDLRAFVKPPDINFDIICADLSFIAVANYAEALANLAETGCKLLCLIKPQFEAGKGGAGKSGIVRDAAKRGKTVAAARKTLALAGFSVMGEAESVVAGSGGNIEYFIYAVRGLE